jgi:hypothetical protein
MQTPQIKSVLSMYVTFTTNLSRAVLLFINNFFKSRYDDTGGVVEHWQVCH